MEIDYIIVGLGLAGLAFIEQLDKQKKSFIVYENGSQKSSRVAGGMYNPVVLKRFTLAWNADSQLKIAEPFYEKIGKKLNSTLASRMKVRRRFNSAEEQNLWFEASDNPRLSQFLSSELVENQNEALDIPYLYGEVMHTGRVAVKELLETYAAHLEKQDQICYETFEYEQVIFDHEHIVYKDLKAKNIVFCEGFGLKRNPFFNYLPLIGNKGEYLIIKSPELRLNEVVKAAIFIIPLGNDTYQVGATYNHEDKVAMVTEKAREEIEKKLKKVLKVSYNIVDQTVAIRPTVIDRKPLVGKHPEFDNAFILNGLGTRGVLIAPQVASQLYDAIEDKVSLDSEIDIRRFEHLF